MKACWAGVCFFAWLITTGSSVWAFYILPVRQEIQLAVGAATQVEYTVYNDADKSRVLEISAVEWRSYPWNKAKGIKFEQWFPLQAARELKIGPGEQKKVVFQIKVPAEAAGELAGMIYFSDPDPSLQYKIKFGVSVYVQIAGTVKRNWELGEVSAEQANEGNLKKLKFVAKVENRGNIHLRPSLEAALENRGAVFKVPFQYGTPVFPGEQAAYAGECTLEQALAQGEYPVTLTVKEPGFTQDFVQAGVLQVSKDQKTKFLKK